jgi:hypothetical protein
MDDCEERREEVEERREAVHLHSSASVDPHDYNDSEPKRFCEASKRFSMEGEKRFTMEADSSALKSRFVEPGTRVLSYPHSMPASPTMLDGRNLAGLTMLRHFARVGGGDRDSVQEEARHEDNHPLDYRFQPDNSEVRGCWCWWCWWCWW